MGLIAGRDVVVKDVAATKEGVVIDASIMALSQSFKAENYNVGLPRGTIHIWGGLIQDRRGQVGYYIESALTSGYAKDYHYDNRVSMDPPPEFPLTGIYTRVSWKERGLDS
jgi:hypothetical protein